MLLVKTVPQKKEMSARPVMREFNKWWLSCYPHSSYDDKGNMKMVSRSSDDGD